MASNFQKQYTNFNYFDQFKDLEIDLSKFLLNFSNEKYTLKLSNLQPVKTLVKNLFEQYKILETYKRDAASFNTYNVQDNERIENISYKFYNSVDWWWIIALFNDIKNPFFDLPLSEAQLIDLSIRLFEEESKYPQKVYYNLLFEANEKRRKINIPKRAFIADIVWKYREAIIKDGKNNEFPKFSNR